MRFARLTALVCVVSLGGAFGLRPTRGTMVGASGIEPISRRKHALLNMALSSGVTSAAEESSTSTHAASRFASGLLADMRRRSPHYVSDWTDGLKKKSIAAILFLYFACLAPTVAFGGLTSIITEGSMGVIEFIVSCGFGGVVYSIFSGQPMTFVGPTGLTLAFTAALYRFTKAKGLPFLVMYSWTGMWTALFLALCSVFNLSDFIKYCTRFTDDCFNALLALNFLFEAMLNLLRNFTKANANSAQALTALNIAIATWWSTKKVAKVKQTRLVSEDFRNFVADFGPVLIILVMSLIASHPAIQAMNIEYLSVPKVFELAQGRNLIPPLLSLSPLMRLACALPALLLTMLFYLDQNITVRAVLSTKPKKGEAYHLDLLVLSFIVFSLSFCGLPWVCAATVQSLNHVRAMSDTTASTTGGPEKFSNMIETRVTGFVIHAAILSSLLLLPALSNIPIPVISGIFLYLGRKLMKGNLLFDRMGQMFVQRELLPVNNVYRKLPRITVAKFIGIQGVMLSTIWYLKQSASLALLFPSCIAVLGFIRIALLPKIFSVEELAALDPPL
jgi:HCO3- transporter family